MAQAYAETSRVPRALDRRYTLAERIGQGGIGEVYRGTQVALDREVAIKLLRPGYTRQPELVARFMREARTLSRLRHPNVVTVFDVGRSPEGQHYLVMELLEGETLASCLEREGALEPERALEIAAQIARGMGAGQGVGLVHRDLKPENLFLERSGLVKILDFGIALLREGGPEEPPCPGLRLLGEGRLTELGAVIGTPRYMAPEQALGWQLDHRADLYAFGCILFEMLSGHPPFQAQRAELYLKFHVHATPPRLADGRPELAGDLDGLVAALLAKDPARRPADWVALGDALRRLMAPAPAPQAPRGPAIEPPRPAEPYCFLRSFSAGTRAIFFGRDVDTRRFRDTWQHPDQTPLLILTGASGVGKSSFLYARVLPYLEGTGHALLTTRGGARPLSDIAAAARRRLARSPVPLPAETPLPEALDRLAECLGQPVTIVLDQLEEVFTEGSRRARLRFQSELAALIGGGGAVRLVLSLREDYLGALFRTLHPLPLEQHARTLALRPLSPEDVLAALTGPTRPGLPVTYAPFRFEPGLAEQIVDDLTRDESGEVAPRIQAVGHRLWEMVRSRAQPVITARHYREELGGAQGIIGRVLDEAIGGLEPRDRELAKELLHALTHLPGSPTSHPTPESQLVRGAGDTERRLEVLRELEGRWRVLHGYIDARWPEERSYRLAHESLIERIREYGLEQSDRNRARQIFQHGLSLWLRGGRTEQDLLSEAHFAVVVAASGDLVLGSPEERDYFEACQLARDRGWLAAYEAQRQRHFDRLLRLIVLPALAAGLGFLLGQAPEDFRTLRGGAVRTAGLINYPDLFELSGMDLSGLDLAGVGLQGHRLSGADLRGADLRGADLDEASLVDARLDRADLREADLRFADLDGADLSGTDLRGARLHGARLDTELRGARFAGAIFDARTSWGDRGPPAGALGVGGSARGTDLSGAEARFEDLYRMDLTEALMPEAQLEGSNMEEARLDGADLSGADLSEADLDRASLVDARLIGAALIRTHLSGAQLQGAALGGADLRGADLSGADLRGADLSGADLSGALLERAALCGADLSGALLLGARWAHASDCPGTFWPGERPDGLAGAAD